MFTRRKNREALFRKTLEEFLRVFPKADETDLKAWSDGLRLLIDLEQRRKSGQPVSLTEDERDELRVASGWSRIDRRFLPRGPLSGFSVHDCSDVVLGNLLCDAQSEARKLAKELKAVKRWWQWPK